jgi:mRNA interferase HigB
VRVIARRTLRQSWERPGRADAAGPLKAWFAEAEQADWRSPADIKASYRSASILRGGRVVFNIAGNKYRLVVVIKYATHLVYVRFVGTHEDYDNIDANEV